MASRVPRGRLLRAHPCRTRWMLRPRRCASPGRHAQGTVPQSKLNSVHVVPMQSGVSAVPVTQLCTAGDTPLAIPAPQQPFPFANLSRSVRAVRLETRPGAKRRKAAQSDAKRRKATQSDARSAATRRRTGRPTRTRMCRGRSACRPAEYARSTSVRPYRSDGVRCACAHLEALRQHGEGREGPAGRV